ncbi:MAG: PD-(D/E)XK nuclease family protein [Candidatus Berkelbacteria bacterium]|nr:PD-(D/E)XK nuclease family protein [Candidatus Berkelbacteria bacterium]
MGYYNPPKPAKYNFDPKSKEPYRMSRSGLELFVRCPRCFYLDKRLGIAPPPTPSFTLNSAVDTLLKKEFDIHRAKGETHPLLAKYSVNARPVTHEKLNEWREVFKGIKFLHKPTNIEFYGGIDDLWINDKDEFIVVDYKATSKEGKIDMEDQWKASYKRQLEIYQWLFRQNGFNVSKTGYFVYCNALKDRKAFDAKLEFDIELIPYNGDDKWIEPKLIEAHKCLKSDLIPDRNENCDYCKYRFQSQKIEIDKKDLETKLESDKKEPHLEGKLF